MSGLRPARRRHRLVLRTAVAAATGVAAFAVWLVLRPEPEAYVPGAPVAGLTDGLARRLPADAPRLRYRDVADEAGVRFEHFHGVRSHQLPEDMGSGAAWGDVDGDGDLDLFAVNAAGPLTQRDAWPASPAHNALYLGDGGGRFQEAAAAAGLDRRGMGMGAAFADADGDGDLDLAVSEYGPLLFYQNDGGIFTEVSRGTGLAGGGQRFWSGLTWLDVDGDGDLDLYACAYVDYQEDPALRAASSRQYDTVIPASLNPATFAPQANALWRNDGDRFVDIAAAAGVANEAGRSLSATAADFDDDGRVDLYVANDLSDNALLHNRGAGVFADVSHEAWVADYRGAMGLAAGDWDDDGDEDLFITHWIAQENALFTNMTGDFRQADVEGRALRFMDTADQHGLGQIALDYVGWGAAFVDVDADGRLDLWVVNGSTFEDQVATERLVPMRPQLFWNAGPRDGFYDLGSAAGDALGRSVVGRGLAVADYDADGDVDAFVSVNGGRGLLLQHEGHTGHWLTVAPDAVDAEAWPGVRIRVVAGERRWTRQAATGSSYLSQHANEEVFGLGSTATIDTLEVLWPDGTRRLRTGLTADARIVVARAATPSADVADAGAASLDERTRVLMFWRIFRAATAARVAGDIEGARTFYDSALALDPTHGDALYHRGSIALALGDYEAAEAAWRRLLASDPSNARAHTQLGALYAGAVPGTPLDLDRARHEFQQALALNRSETGPQVRLGEVELLAGNLAAARRHLQAARQTNARSSAAHFLSGYLDWVEGDTAAAMAHLGRAVDAARGAHREHSASAEGQTRRGNRPLLEGGADGPLAPAWRHLEAWDGEVTAPATAECYDRLREMLAQLRRGTP